MEWEIYEKDYRGSSSCLCYWSGSGSVLRLRGANLCPGDRERPYAPDSSGKLPSGDDTRADRRADTGGNHCPAAEHRGAGRGKGRGQAHDSDDGHSLSVAVPDRWRGVFYKDGGARGRKAGPLCGGDYGCGPGRGGQPETGCADFGRGPDAGGGEGEP